MKIEQVHDTIQTEPTDSSPADQKSKTQNQIPSRRRTGKIARLPKKLRDLINNRLSDGLPYDQIASELNQSSDPPLPYEISTRNLSDWFAGGHQDWLRQQETMDLLACRFDMAIDLAQNTPPEKLQELSLQLASIRMCEFLSQLAIADPNTDPVIYLRLLSALPRISREALNLQKYRDASENSVPAQPLDPATQAEREQAQRNRILDQVDELFGLGRHRPPLPPGSPQIMFSTLAQQPQIQIPSIPPATETHGNPQKPNPEPDASLDQQPQVQDPPIPPATETHPRKPTETFRLGAACDLFDSQPELSRSYGNGGPPNYGGGRAGAYQ